MIQSPVVVVLNKISAGASRERPRTSARHMRKPDGTTPHEAAPHRRTAIPRLSTRLPRRSNRAETTINRANDDLGQACGA